MSTSDQSLVEVFNTFVESINEMDVILDSMSGSKNAGRRKTINTMVEGAEEQWTSIVSQVSEYLDSLTEQERVAVFFGVVETLRKEYEKPANSYVEAIVDAQPKQEALVSEEQAAELATNRKAMYDKAKSIADLVKQLDDIDLEMPKARRGSTGPRGKRAMTLLTYFENGEEVDKTPGQIATTNGYEKSSEWTAALKEAGYNTSTLTEIKDFVMPNGVVVSGVLEEDDTDDDE